MCSRLQEIENSARIRSALFLRIVLEVGRLYMYLVGALLVCQSKGVITKRCQTVIVTCPSDVSNLGYKELPTVQRDYRSMRCRRPVNDSN